MWLVICEPDDTSALWAYQGLRRRGLIPIELVSPAVLGSSLRWEHRVDSDGATIKITLADGRRIHDGELRGVLNRMYSVPLTMWNRAAETDRLYVQQELFAFYLSWLHSLPCPVFNRSTAMGLAGAWRPESAWLCLAATAGLPTPVYRQTNFDRVDETLGQRRLLPAGIQAHSVIVAGQTVAGAAVPAAIGAGCLRLAQLSATDLLGVDFIAGSAGAWTFAGATPLPELRLSGDPLLYALAADMREGSSAS